MDRFVPAAQRSPHPTILYSGALTEPRKGVASLLDALPLIAAHEPDVRLQLSGPGDAAALLAAAPAAARERTDVLPVGAVEDQPGRYGRAWACALPSENDTFGLVLIEALACGTPIVAADNAALPELVTPGVTGALCRHGDVASIAQACIDAIALARLAGTSDACRESARPFDWMTGVAPRCIAVYEEAIGGPR
jgi:phosphatidylinositol alpha-mannosyltransferase